MADALVQSDIQIQTKVDQVEATATILIFKFHLTQV